MFPGVLNQSAYHVVEVTVKTFVIQLFSIKYILSCCYYAVILLSVCLPVRAYSLKRDDLCSCCYRNTSRNKLISKKLLKISLKIHFICRIYQKWEFLILFWDEQIYLIYWFQIPNIHFVIFQSSNIAMLQYQYSINFAEVYQYYRA